MTSGISGASKPSSRTPSPENTDRQQKPLKRSQESQGSLSSQSFQTAHGDPKMSNDDELSSSDEKDYSELKAKAVADAKAKAAADAKAKADKEAHDALVEKFRGTFKKPEDNHKQSESKHQQKAIDEHDTFGMELLPLKKRPIEQQETDKKTKSNDG
jgi:membrane protein involved in colicin uptake